MYALDRALGILEAVSGVDAVVPLAADEALFQSFLGALGEGLKGLFR